MPTAFTPNENYTPSTVSLNADYINSYNVTISTASGDNQLFLDPSSIDISYNGANAHIEPTIARFTDLASGNFASIGVNSIDVSGSTASLNLTSETGKISITGTSIVFTDEFGVSNPGSPGDVLTSSGTGKTPVWQTITEFLNIETGTFDNTGNYSGVDVSFDNTYPTIPTVILTSNADGSGNIIPVSLNGVTEVGFRVLFGSRTLTKLNYVVLPQKVSKNQQFINDVDGNAPVTVGLA